MAISLTHDEFLERFVERNRQYALMVGHNLDQYPIKINTSAEHNEIRIKIDLEDFLVNQINQIVLDSVAMVYRDMP